MGTHLILAATSSGSGSSSSLLIFVVIIVLMILFLFRSQRRRTQAAQTTQRNLVNGARVRTVHGIYGTVVDSDDQNVLVEVAPGVEIKMLRQAVGTVLPDDTPDGIQHDGDDVEDGEEADEYDADDEVSDDNETADEASAPEKRSDLSR